MKFRRKSDPADSGADAGANPGAASAPEAVTGIDAAEWSDAGAAGTGILTDAVQGVLQVRSDEDDVRRIQIDRQRLLGAGDGAEIPAAGVRGVPHALSDERARCARTAHHEDPHRPASFRPILVKTLRVDNHSCFRRGGNLPGARDISHG